MQRTNFTVYFTVCVCDHFHFTLLSLHFTYLVYIAKCYDLAQNRNKIKENTGHDMSKYLKNILYKRNYIQHIINNQQWPTTHRRCYQAALLLAFTTTLQRKISNLWCLKRNMLLCLFRQNHSDYAHINNQIFTMDHY